MKLDDLSKKRKPDDGENSKDLHNQKTKASRSERKKRRKEKKEQVVEAAKDAEERSEYDLTISYCDFITSVSS